MLKYVKIIYWITKCEVNGIENFDGKITEDKYLFLDTISPVTVMKN